MQPQVCLSLNRRSAYIAPRLSTSPHGYLPMPGKSRQIAVNVRGYADCVLAGVHAKMNTYCVQSSLSALKASPVE